MRTPEACEAAAFRIFDRHVAGTSGEAVRGAGTAPRDCAHEAGGGVPQRAVPAPAGGSNTPQGLFYRLEADDPGTRWMVQGPSIVPTNGVTQVVEVNLMTGETRAVAGDEDSGRGQ